MSAAPEVKPNGYTRKAVKARRRRAQWHAQRARRAEGEPAAELAAAIDRLKSAAAHTRRPEWAVVEVADGIAAHVRELAADLELPPASTGHNEAALAGARSGCGRLSVALRWLWAVVARMPPEHRQGAYTGYAQQLTGELDKLPPADR